MSAHSREVYLILFLVILATSHLVDHPSASHLTDLIRSLDQCSASQSPTFNPATIRILYDVNRSEGFNLRRDVYLRLAVFTASVRRLPGWSDVKLVLPPFQNLYHWHSNRNRDVSHFWNHFFDLPSMAGYTDVLDLWQFFDEPRSVQGVAHVVQLRNFEDMFENGRFVEKYLLDELTQQRPTIDAAVLGYSNISRADGHWACRFQGSVMQLQPMIEQLWRRVGQPAHLTVFVRNAEVVLHDGFGDAEFWRARRSMRFARPLVAVAQRFRETVMQVDEQLDAVQRPPHWQDERPYRRALGGNYMCAHLRRGDFLHGRSRTTPSLRSAAQQIKHELKANGLNTVFISSDCVGTEFNDLKRSLSPYRAVRYKPETQAERERLGDGAIAIVDQIICARARYFVGTFDSTFTYRIYEEREILGFTSESTFNTLCVHYGRPAEECERNSVWPVVYA